MGQDAARAGTRQDGWLTMHPQNFVDIIGAILIIALVATILTKKNTAADVTASGNAFSGALKTAEAG